MNKIFRLVGKYLMQQKLRSIVVILVLSIAAAIYIIVSGSYLLIKEIAIQNAIDESGAQHFIYKFPKYNEVEKLKGDMSINRIGTEWYLGIESYGDKELLLLYRDEAYSFMDSSLTVLEDGRMPENVNEIVLTSDFMLDQKLNVGDQVRLNYEKYNFERGKFIYEDNRIFTITGSISNSSEGKIHNVMFGLVSEALFKEYSDKIEIENVRISLLDDSNIKLQITSLTQKHSLDPKKIVMNDDLIYAIGDTNSIQLITIIIKFVIAFSMGLVTYNILYFNFVHRNRDLGVMRSLGFNCYELAMIVFMEVTFYIILSIPIGILLGIGFNQVFLNEFLGSFINLPALKDFNGVRTFNISIKVIHEAIILSILTLAPSTIKPFFMSFKISPMDAVRQGRANIKIKLSRVVVLLSKRIKNILIVYAIKNLSRNRKRTIVTILSISATLILIISMIVMNSSTFIDSSFIKKYFVPGDIKVEVKGIGWEREENSFSEDTLDEIRSFDNIEKVNAYKIRALWAISYLDSLEKTNSLLQEFDTEYIQTNTVQYRDQNLFFYNILAIGTNNLEEYLAPEISDADVPIIVIDEEYAKLLDVHVGDKVSVSNCDEDHSLKELAVQPKEVMIGGILESLPLMNESGSGRTTILMDIEDVNEITQTKDYDRFDIWVKNINDLNTVLEIDSIEEIHAKGDIVTFKDKEEQYLQGVKSRKTAQLVFNLIFAGMAMISLLNTLITNIINREQELLTLYAIGITENEIKKNIIFEGSLYSILSVIITMPLQILICILLSDQIRLITILTLITFNIGVIVIGGIFAKYSYLSVFKSNDIAKLKVE